MKGSLTVEAAYVFPICFMVIGLACILGIFQYNRAVLTMTGYECIVKTMEERNLSEDVFQRNLLERAENTAKERILCVKDFSTELTMTASRISISYQGTQQLLNIPLEVTLVYQRTSPEQTLRLMKR